MKILKPKTIIIVLTALVSLVYFWLFLNRYLYKPKAAAEKINVTFAPTSGNFKVGERKSLDVIIQPANSGRKISGLDLVFTASGNLAMLGLTAPAPYPEPNPPKSNPTQILSDVKEKQARVVYVFSNPDEQLPTALILKMDFQGTTSGAGGVKLETGKSQVVGNVSGNLYDFGSVSQANFNFTGTPISPTSTPASVTPPIPTSNPNCLCLKGDICDASCVFKEHQGIPYIQPKKCSLSPNLFPAPPTQANKNTWCQRPYRTSGDADGNGKVEKVDYYYYVSAVNGGKIPASVNPDFNGDGEVGVADREIILKTLNSPAQCKVDSDCPQVACPPCKEGEPCPTCGPVRCVDNRCLQVSPIPQPTSTSVCIKTDSGESMDFEQAMRIALTSDCVKEGSLKEDRFCNQTTGTWWIDLDIEKLRSYCNPACVIDVVTKKAEINPRCTGILTPTP